MRSLMKVKLLTAVASILTGCAGVPEPKNGESLTVAVAANLTGVMDEIARSFERETSIPVTVSFGSTAQLAQQVQHGAPFDLFAAADIEHVDTLIATGKLRKESRAIYARGQLVFWCPDAAKSVRLLSDLTKPAVRFVAIAQPDLAPYGRATVEALKAAAIWDQIQPKVTYAKSISMAKQYASSGNADVAFIALSLVMKERGAVIKVDPSLYRPIDQAMAITTGTQHPEAARRFADFVLGDRGRALFAATGYLLP